METVDQLNAKNSLKVPEHGPKSLNKFSRSQVKVNSSKQADLEDAPRLDPESRSAKGQNRNGDLLRQQQQHNVNAAEGSSRGDAPPHLLLGSFNCCSNKSNRARIPLGNSINADAPLHLLLSSDYSSNDNANEDDDLLNAARILLENGANVDAKNVEGKSALHAAVARGAMQVLELLLAHGADLRTRDNRGFGVLHYLAGSLHNAPVCANLARLLLDLGCDVNATSQHGRTPLYVAVCTGHNVCFDLLIERGANIRCRDGKFDTTILHIAAKYAKNYVVDKLIGILNKGDHCGRDAMINAKQIDGRTALHLATRHKLTSILTMLLRNGADVESLDSLGRTALHYACYYNNAEAFDILLDFGADLSVEDNKGCTPMNLNAEIEALIWLRVVTRNAKSMAAGLPVVDFRQNLSKIMPKMRSYDKYRAEVDQMRQEMINSKVSVYDLLLDKEKMYKYRNNVVLKDIVLHGKLFSSYREMLIGKYRTAGMRRYFVKLATKALWQMIGYRMENALCDMIFDKLSNAELHDFIEAAVRDDRD